MLTRRVGELLAAGRKADGWDAEPAHGGDAVGREVPARDRRRASEHLGITRRLLKLKMDRCGIGAVAGEEASPSEPD